MKRSLIIMLVATLLAGALMVSCNSDITSNSEDKLVKVSIAGNSKGIDVQSVSDNADDYYWYYKAVKTDNSVYRTGSTVWKAVKNGTGLTGADLGYFSTGDWKFSFWGYSEAVATTPETVPATGYAYYKTDLAVSVTDTTYITVELNAVGTGTAKVVIGDMNWVYQPETDTAYQATLDYLNGKTATIHFDYKTGTNEYASLTTNTATISSSSASAAASFTDFANNLTLAATAEGTVYKIKAYVTIGDETVGESSEYTVTAYYGGKVVLTMTGDEAVTDNESGYHVFIAGSYIPEIGAAAASSKTAIENVVVDNQTVSAAKQFTTNITAVSQSVETATESAQTSVAFEAGSFTLSTGSNTSSEIKMDIVVYQTEAAQAKFTVSQNTTAFAGLDLSVDLITTTTTDTETTTTTESVESFHDNKAVTVTTYIARGLSGVTVTCPTNNTGITFNTGDSIGADGTGYDPATGKLVFKTTHFSEFAVGADQNVYDKTSNTAYRLGTSTDGDAKKGLLLDTANNVVAVDSSHEYLLLDNTKANDVADSIDAFNSNIKWSAVHAANDTPSTLFDGGYGTKIEPYLISSVSELSHINEITVDSYFKVKDQNSTMNLTKWTPIVLYGSFNGNGATINSDDSLFKAVRANDKAVIRDFTINADISVSHGVGAVINDGDALTIILKGIAVHGTIIGANWVTPFVEFGPGPSYAWYVSFEDCVSDATLVATSGATSGFIGHPYDDVSNGSTNGLSTITIKDSAFTGSMSAIGNVTGYNFKYFTINGNDNRVRTKYSEDFINALGYNPEGTLYATPADITNFPVNTDSEGYKVFFCGNYGKNVVDNYKPADKKATLNTTNQMTLPSNKGDVFTVTKVDGVAKAVASLLIAPNDSNNYGSYLGTYMEEVITISGSDTSFTTSNVKYFNITINDGTTSTSGVTTSGDTYNVVSSYYGHNAHNGATVKVVQYDSSGNVLNVSSLVIATPHVAE